MVEILYTYQNKLPYSDGKKPYQEIMPMSKHRQGKTKHLPLRVIAVKDRSVLQGLNTKPSVISNLVHDKIRLGLLFVGTVGFGLGVLLRLQHSLVIKHYPVFVPS